MGTKLDCYQEGRISAIEAIMKQLNDTINGNHKEGIKNTVIRLDERTKNIAEDVSKIATSTSAIARFQTEIKIEKKLLQKQRNKRRRLITIIITLILGIAGLIINLIIGG